MNLSIAYRFLCLALAVSLLLFIPFVLFFFADWNIIYGEELYDHRMDAGEEFNVVSLPQYDEIRQQLRRQLIAAVG